MSCKFHGKKKYFITMQRKYQIPHNTQSPTRNGEKAQHTQRQHQACSGLGYLGKGYIAPILSIFAGGLLHLGSAQFVDLTDDTEIEQSVLALKDLLNGTAAAPLSVCG